MTSPLLDAMLGLAVGDALGVPFEFQSRAQLNRQPCTGMVAFGSHYQPLGTWSDDTSMALILVESLQNRWSAAEELAGYRHWYHEGYRTPHGVCFDIGGTTLQALGEGRGLAGEHSNGNGSLMRIAPLAWFVDGASADERRRRAFAESAITHAHRRSQLACWLFVEVLGELRTGAGPTAALDTAWARVDNWARSDEQSAVEWVNYLRCQSSISLLGREQIASSGYVVHTLEAALWCLLTTNSYAEAVLLAVNLGSDTDTTAAVTGALAGTVYGWRSIPPRWLSELVKVDEIVELCGRIAP